MSANTIQWPTAQTLLAVADAAESFAATIEANILTSAPDSPAQLPCFDENFYAVREDIRLLDALLYQVHPNAKALSEKKASQQGTIIGCDSTGWGSAVARAFRSLWRTYNGLKVYFGYQVQSLGWYKHGQNGWEPITIDGDTIEHPPLPRVEFTEDGRPIENRTGLPIEWLTALRDSATRLRECPQLRWKDFPNLFPAPLGLKTLLHKTRVLEERIIEYNARLTEGGDLPASDAGAVEAKTLLQDWTREVLGCLDGYDFSVDGWSGPGFISDAIRSLSKAAARCGGLEKHVDATSSPIPPDTIIGVSSAVSIFEHRLEWARALSEQMARVRDVEDRTGAMLKSWNDAQWFVETFEQYNSAATSVTFANYCKAKAAGRVAVNRDGKLGDSAPIANLRPALPAPASSLPSSALLEPEMVKLPGFGERFTPISKDQLEGIAGEVHLLIHRYNGLSRFREVLWQWRTEHNPSDPLSFPLPIRGLKLPEKYAVLSAIHDKCNGGWEPVDPWPIPAGRSFFDLSSEDRHAAMAYTALRQSVLQVVRGAFLHGGIPQRNEAVLRTILADVETDVVQHAGKSVADPEYRGSPPKRIESITDPSLRQRAIEGWHAVNDLLDCEMPWREWLKQLRMTGDADPGLAVRLYEKVARCAHIIIKLRVNSEPFHGASVRDIVARFPVVPSGELADADFGIEAWQKTFPIEEAEKRFREMHSFVGELHAIRGLLETAPSTVFESRDAEPVNTLEPSQPADNREQFVFRSDGGGYRIVGFGESGWIKSLLGLDYIQRLISTPRQPAPMIELTGAVRDERSGTDHRSQQPAFDRDAKLDLRRRDAELQAELERAQWNNDPGAIDRLQAEKEALEEQMRVAVGLGGRPRDLNNPLDKLRPKICSALSRAYRALRKADPQMSKVAEHFEASIAIEGGCFIYRPAAQEINWRTQ